MGLATAASRTTNPLLLGLVLAVAAYVVTVPPHERAVGEGLRLLPEDGRGRSSRIRVVFAAVVRRTRAGSRTIAVLPEAQLPEWAAGVRLGGELTVEGLAGAVYAGLQLATMLACVGAANALANPRRLLRAVPGALYEVGVAVVVALSFSPQLVEGVSPGPRTRAGCAAAHAPRGPRPARRRDAGAGRRPRACPRPRGGDGRPRLRPDVGRDPARAFFRGRSPWPASSGVRLGALRPARRRPPRRARASRCSPLGAASWPASGLALDGPPRRPVAATGRTAGRARSGSLAGSGVAAAVAALVGAAVDPAEPEPLDITAGGRRPCRLVPLAGLLVALLPAWALAERPRPPRTVI